MTLFNRYFRVATIRGSKYDPKGNLQIGEVAPLDVRGSIQPVTGKDTLAFEMGSRDAGKVKVYSTERLQCRERGVAEGDFVVYCSRPYQLVGEMPYANGVIPHFKYYADLVPLNKVPDAVLIILGLKND